MDARSFGESLKLPESKEHLHARCSTIHHRAHLGAVQALLPHREVDHPLGCHRSRIPDRVVFGKLIEILVFGCAYWRIAEEECSATTIRRRRDEWMKAGVMDALETIAL